MKICIFGSGSGKTPKEYTEVGYELGLKIAENGHSLVFGGGNEGMMGAVASGVYDNNGEIKAIAPSWIKDFNNEFKHANEFIKTATMHQRKELFLEESDVFIVCPGGVGTMDELFNFITLRELERHNKKIILFNINHFYDLLFSMLLKMNYEGITTDKTIKMIEVATTVDGLFELL